MNVSRYLCVRARVCVCVCSKVYHQNVVDIKNKQLYEIKAN